MTFAKDDLIAALRLRYDYYSARSMFDLARERAELPDKPAYDATELRGWRMALLAVGDRLDSVVGRLDYLAEGAAAESAAVAPSAPASGSDSDKAGRKNAAKVAANVAPQVAATAPKAAATDAPGSMAPAGSAPAASIASETTVVLDGVTVAEGEQVMMCGGFAELGDWDPERARPMSREGDRWRATITVAPGTEIAFKFLRRTADGKVIWESGGDRSLGAEPRVDATWR